MNPKLKLILADVDETIADVYTDATQEMVDTLSNLLSQEKVIFFVSGGGYKSIFDRVISKIDPGLRHKTILAHCSGAEVIGFDKNGNRLDAPYYSLYDKVMNANQKTKWRELMQDIIEKFHLQPHAAMQVSHFREKVSTHPLSVMYADRGPQITIEFVNAFQLTPEQFQDLGIAKVKTQEGKTNFDLRDNILPYAKEKIKELGLPVEIDYGGMFAMDFKLLGVNKTLAVKYILENTQILNSIGLNIKTIDDPAELEIWGDKFSETKGGSDRYMCFAVNPEVRSIDFRDEDISEFPKGYNIVLWDGTKKLHEGTLEYLISNIDNHLKK